jgi:hypothetical protein
MQPDTVAARSKAWTFFARSSAGVFARIPLEAIKVCVCFVLSYV